MSLLKEMLKREPIFINPYTDFGFKRLFGEENSKDLLIDFLNQMLPPHHQIVDLTFENVENTTETQGNRKAVFDILCATKGGKKVIIEMQKNKFLYFEDRSLYYTAYPIRQQGRQGEWDFNLNPVYLVAVLDYEYDTEKVRREIIRYVSLTDQNGELFSDKLHFIFVQMPLFDKKESQLETRLDKWLFFLKNLETFDNIPQILNEPIFQQGFEKAKIAKMSNKDFAKYEQSRLAYFESKAVVETALLEGEARGEIKGEEKKAIEVITVCIQKGFSLELTAEIATKSIEYVKEVVQRLGLLNGKN
jgi:predicted transposase/invertase (TIGR01784 family)